MFLMVIAGWLMPSVQAYSHGAGHSLPVKSGKLLVACRRSTAAAISALHTWSFHSGMRLPRGQAEWQKGMPQFMQREAWRRSMGSSWLRRSSTSA